MIFKKNPNEDLQMSLKTKTLPEAIKIRVLSFSNSPKLPYFTSIGCFKNYLINFVAAFNQTIILLKEELIGNSDSSPDRLKDCFQIVLKIIQRIHSNHQR